MGNFPFAAVPPIQRQAATPVAGFALQNATPTIMTWTAPNDGVNHRVQVFGETVVSSAETGGSITATYTAPGGTVASPTLDGGGNGLGATGWAFLARVVAPGTTVSVQQSAALTVGAAIVYAEIWGS